jgi:hypothetical protein
MKVVAFYSTDYWPIASIKRRLIWINFPWISELMEAGYDFGRSRRGKK